MKILVIGAGISGLSIAHLLAKDNEVVVMESESRPGGLIKCDIIEGSLFHRTGGHVFNTRRKDVTDWFWSFFNKEIQFTKAIRNSTVVMSDGCMIPYPIENHAYMLEPEIGKKIIDDLIAIASTSKQKPENFEEFLKWRFGNTLYHLYFQPYNWKVWRRDLTKVPLSWLEGKLPMPTVAEILFNNIYHIKEQKFVHSSFYYPKKGGSQFIADTLSKGITILFNHKVNSIKRYNSKWNVNDMVFDKIVFCGNIKQLPSLLSNSIDMGAYSSKIEMLESHGTTSVFCEIEKNPYSWIYQPNMIHYSHRIICSGNFSSSNNAKGKMTGTVEFTDFVDKEEIENNLKVMPFSPKYLTHNYEKYTYPIQDTNTRSMVQSLKTALATIDFYLCGRFAEWEYANMDVCMGSAIDLYKKILKH